MPHPNTPPTTAATTRAQATRATRRLLASGAIAGPLFVAVSLTQALTREGFDLTRHAWSLLANGDLGWIQVTNMIVTGLLVIAGAAGLHRALHPGTGATWAPRLVAGYGLGMVGAGIFRADPALGFPAGTPEEVTVGGHGILHFVLAGVGFGCLVAACFVLGRRFRADGRRGWVAFSRITGVLFLAGFLALATGDGHRGATLAFVVAMSLAWVWLSAMSIHYYHRAPRGMPA